MLKASGGTNYEFFASVGLFGVYNGQSFQTPFVLSGSGSTTFVKTRSDGNFGWVSGGDPTTAPDTNLSRVSAGVVAVGNGTQGNKSGEIQATTLNLTNSNASTPAAGTINIFSRQIANRNLPAFSGQNGLDSALQPFLARNKVGYWCPPGNATTAPGVVGFSAATATGFTATSRSVATTNIFTRMRRLGYVSAATAGTVGQWRVNAYQYTVGSVSTGLGGFTYIKRFGISDAAAVSDARMFIGMRSSSTPSNVEPSTLNQCIGVGHNAAHTNLHIFYGGTSAQTPIDLGANFPITHGSIEPYELALFSDPNSGDVHWQVTRLSNGITASGSIVNSGAAVLPSNATLLAPWGYRTNNGTALAVGLDVMSAYIETDY